MPQLFLEVYHLSDQSEAEVPVQTAVCLFLVKYLNFPSNININLVINEQESPGLTVKLESVKYTTSVLSRIQPPISDCHLPVFAADEISCVAGLCAVLRQVLKQCGEEWHHLLGFRDSSLFACAEVSLWTKFCEVDVVNVVNHLLSNNVMVTDEVKVPIDLARFEEHLKQPVRAHNIEKLKKKHIENKVEHIFAEGHLMSLADLIILPCVHVFLNAFNSSTLATKLPFVLQWYDLVVGLKSVKQALSIIQDIPSRINKLVYYIVPEVAKHSLYKSDPKRYKPRWKQFTRQDDVEEALAVIDTLLLDLDYDRLPYGQEMCINWKTLPKEIQPDVPLARLARKKEQVENLVNAILKVAKPGDTIVDFCCGSGHLGIVVASCLPHCRIVLLDNKEQSLDRAKARVSNLGLTNVTAIQSNIDYYIGSFEIGVSLHACGVASDLVIHSCLQRNASFVVCPCCYGSLQINHMVNYPQSSEMALLSARQFFVIGHCADQTHTQDCAKNPQGEACMAIVDHDRRLLAESRGYFVSLAKLVPRTCTPKNNLLVGIPHRLNGKQLI